MSSIIRSPANTTDCVGMSTQATKQQCLTAMNTVHQGWQRQQKEQRATDLITMIQHRSVCLIRWAELLDRHRPELMTLLVREAGKTLQDAQDEIREAIDFCRYYAQQTETLYQPQPPLSGVTGEHNQLQLNPRGIWLCISPWNFPLAIFIGQISAALATGNMVIAKPATATPLIATRAVELAYEAGIQTDWLQLIITSADHLYPAILHHDALSGVAFTGSLSTAKLLAEQLAQRPQQLIPLIAETGGQNTMLVDSSALLEQVVQDGLTSAFSSAGQRCSACRMILIQEDIANQCVDMLINAMHCLTLGDPLLRPTDVGPLIDERAQRAVEHHIQQMQALNYRITRHHGKSKTMSSNTHGHFCLPCCIDLGQKNFLDNHIRQQLSRQFSEEVFGPVLHIIRFKGDQLLEVVDWVNSLGFGLTMAIHSRNPDVIRQVEISSQVGNLYVNRDQIGAIVESQPFGGIGLSGTGPKAGGPHYLPAFTWEKVITTNTTAVGANTELMIGKSAQ